MMPYSHITGTHAVIRHTSIPQYPYPPRRIEDGVEEIEIILGGHGRFDSGDGLVEDGAGLVMWHYGGEVKYNEVLGIDDPYHSIAFTFTAQLSDAPRMPRMTRWLDPALCLHFCEEAFALFHCGEMPADFTAYHYLRLRWEAHRYLVARREDTVPANLWRARLYLQQHYHEPLDVETLAAVAGVSASHLHLLFRQHLGISPMQLLVQERIARAREMLISTSHSIKEICFATGFQSPVHFCRAFKQRVGISPGAYRRQFVYALPGQRNAST